MSRHTGLRSLTSPSATTRHGAAARRAGYLAAAAVDAVLIAVINVWPGWQAVSVLTPAAAEVVALINMALVVGIVASLLQVAADAAWLHWLAETITGAIGLAVLMRTLRVFPFTFADEEWAWAVRLGLVLLIVVTAIALVVAVVRFAAELATHESTRTG